MTTKSAVGSRRWLIAQRPIPDLVEDTPGAIITVVIDCGSGLVCGMDVGEDSGESVAAALGSRVPGADDVPEPDEIVVPSHLLASVRLNLGHFAHSPSVLDPGPEDAEAADTVLDTMLATLSAGGIIGDVDPSDWAALIEAAATYLTGECWQELGETPIALTVDLDSVTTTRVLTAIGDDDDQASGLVVFPGTTQFRKFLTRSEASMELDAFPKGTVAFIAGREDDLEPLRLLCVEMGWPEDDERTPMVVRCTRGGHDQPTTGDVRLATVALIATTRYARDGIETGEMTLQDDAVVSYSIAKFDTTPALQASPSAKRRR